MGFEAMLILPLKLRITPFVLCATLLLQVCFSQVQVDDARAKEVLRRSDAEQVEFVKSVLDQQFPETQGDRFSLLLVNRSELVIPLVESKVERELSGSFRSERFIDLACAMISYAGDEQALRAINRLLQIDEKRFGPFVGRTLNSAANWRNPFTVAYRRYALGDATLARRIADWSESTLSTTRMQRMFAEAMVTEYGHAPGEGEWANDPIASRMRTRPQLLKESVLRLAKDADAKREK